MKLSLQEETVPGLDSSATNTIMAGSSSPFSASRADMNILEMNKKLCFQLEETKQQLRDFKEKFLISEATVYSLANQLWKYKCGDFKVIESVLGEKLQPKEGELTETLVLTEKLRESNILIKDQARKLSQLEQKLQQGRDVSFLLSQHLKDLLTQDDSSDEQAPRFQEQLAEGCWLAECLVLKLSPGNHEEEGNDNDYKWLSPRLSREGQEERVKETLEDSLDEGLRSSSSYIDFSKAHHHPSITDALLDDCEESSLDAAGTQDNKKQEEEEEPMIFRDLQEAADISAVLQHTVDEIYVAPSSCQDLCDVHQTPDTPASTPEEQVGSGILDTDENQSGCQAQEGQEANYPVCYDLCDFHQTLNAPEFQPEEQLVWCFLDMDGEDTPEN
ncbi:NBPF family member NBPF6-like protein isoform X2 [Castor canadensis]|uniref:NBPF family member NBPF6-like protein isoform X2 n=1 Tax=Castor canadensis TaxID=51338 RepID=A0AC58KNY5_CASCN